jgi:tetratricopeptide (TPR) repeat protein
MTYFNEEALLQRLSTGLHKRPQEVVFLVGAPLTAPVATNSLGVLGVDGIIHLIRKEFENDAAEGAAFDKEVADSGVRRYQSAFSFLQGRRGQATANEVVRTAVLGARNPDALFIPINSGNQAAIEDACQTLDSDSRGWHLNPGIGSLGKIVAEYPDIFGKIILTTNFDPLIEVSIQRAGGSHYRTSLYSDGNLTQTKANGCHVIHLHGFWHGTDTLHTPQQLRQDRPYLKDSLRSLLREKLVVVCAYGGWDDIFTKALIEVVKDITENPEVLWAFHDSDPGDDDPIRLQLMPGIVRGRVNLYAGIDCNLFFPNLHDRWTSLKPGAKQPSVTQSNPVRVSATLSLEVRKERTKPTVIEGDDEDHPPRVDICVGRENEIESLKLSRAQVVFITGIGGQGKSTLAAQYFSDCQNDGKFSLFVWRDCKAESERFENQLSSVIEKLSDGRISGEDLGRQSGASIVRVFLSAIASHRALFVFDNADHYVDLEAGVMTGASDLLVKALMESGLGCQVVFTCRPAVNYRHPATLSVRLEGLGFEPTLKLFSQRGATSSNSEIEGAHEITSGHAFWLDLLAIQVAKAGSQTSLRAIVSQISSAKEYLPEQTLKSIWDTLKPQEQTVLRSMAEALKPATEMEISDYLSGELTYKKVMKALKNLRVLNLVVIKQPEKSSDVLELHPIVRAFIKTTFAQRDRLSYINRILAVYARLMGTYKMQLRQRPSFLMLQHWTQSAELDMAAGKFDEAFGVLGEVANPFQGSAYPREFTRTVRALMEASDWTTNHDRYKNFETVFRPYIHFLADMGENREIDETLEKYEISLQNKDWRYISYCDLRCYSKWMRGDFTTAVKWGQKGQDLKSASGVDTKIDTAHTLALAERDAGRPEVALQTFLAGRSLEEVTDAEELDEARPGHYYGNVGRCLHLMGQLEGALACYQKSALLLEKTGQRHIVNEGFSRAWIGELLLARGQTTLAGIFYRAAHFKWQQTAPPRAARVQQVLSGLGKEIVEITALNEREIENVCLDWILGGNLDSSFP